MSANDFVEIKEVALGKYSVCYGFVDDEDGNGGREVLYTDNLKEAIITARDPIGAGDRPEYGPYFTFLDDNLIDASINNMDADFNYDIAIIEARNRERQ